VVLPLFSVARLAPTGFAPGDDKNRRGPAGH
jgi:hypothetical protein